MCLTQVEKLSIYKRENVNDSERKRSIKLEPVQVTGRFQEQLAQTEKAARRGGGSKALKRRDE